MQPQVQKWRRMDRPILSSHTAEQPWCRILLYSPSVLWHDGRYRMWFVGSDESRTPEASLYSVHLGYAESDDAVNWRLHPDNPVLRCSDLPWTAGIQTPHVLYDEQRSLFVMWFTASFGRRQDASGEVIDFPQALAYAISPDGLKWEVHPELLYESGRSPCVIQQPDGSYRMWMNSRPDSSHPWDSIYSNIFEFRSDDGIAWTRGERPVLQPSGVAASCVYPFVLQENGFHMWVGCHRVEGEVFEVFSATSVDGTLWQPHFDVPALPRSQGRERFDARYTSTPCVLSEPDRYLMFYSARDWQTQWVGADGRTHVDNMSVYAHIGLAVWRKTDTTPGAGDA